MLFPGIVGQPRATAALAGALRGGRLVPSLLFHGPPGVGKLTTALALARGLLCRADGARPCGACGACRRIDARALTHPDVRVVFPETRRDYEEGRPAAEGRAGIDLQERQDEAIAHPFWTILIDRVRDAITALQRPPAEGAWSLLIIDQAHRMESEPANALLKTLEEPPPHAILLLLTPSFHALLPTIRSRCRAIPFQLVPAARIIDHLVEGRGLPPEEAALRAGLAGGRIGAALDLDVDDHRRRREAVLGCLEAVALEGDAGIAVARAEALVKGGAALEGDLQVLMTLLRDLLILEAAPGAAALLVNADLETRLPALAARLAGRLPDAIASLEATLDGLRHKGNRQLLVENCLLGLLPPAAGGPGPRPGGDRPARHAPAPRL